MTRTGNHDFLHPILPGSTPADIGQSGSLLETGASREGMEQDVYAGGIHGCKPARSYRITMRRPRPIDFSAMFESMA
ncbi:MAG: hypothetical protein ACLQVD_21355 [Capsulimonadaceae bacterium]